MLTPEFSRQRQARLLQIMHTRRLDAVVIGASPHVYYFSAFLPAWQHQAGFVLFADGRSQLVTPNIATMNVAADEVVPYEANWFSTLRQEQPATVADQLLAALAARGARSIGVDASAVSSQVVMGFHNSSVSIDSEIWQLRRRKDPDELALMKTAIRSCKAMYARAKQIITPGVSELEVFSELHAVAVKTSGEEMFLPLGNDYACGVPGGPPRFGRLAADGEMYILDLGPTFHGYFSDNARSFAVNRKPTDEQHKAWESIVGALRIVEKMARPGVRGVDLFRAVDEHFRHTRKTGLTHHLGHGVGLQPHEYPHLNPKWDDVLIEGEIFTAEPGQYGPEINGGIRLENQYLVTKDGATNLVDFPLDLV